MGRSIKIKQRFKHKRRWKKHVRHRGGRWQGDYGTYLKTSHWAKKRAAFLGRYPKCYVCGAIKNCQVHHKTYTHLGREPVRDLVTLCKYHHNLLHKHNLPLATGHIFLSEENYGDKPVPEKTNQSKKKKGTRYYVDPTLLHGESGVELDDIIDQAEHLGR